MKSATNVVPTLPFWPFALLHIGPRPTIISVISERVNGLRNTTSFSNCQLLPRNSLAPPISISSQSLIALNSTESEGPVLKSPPGTAHSPATPIMPTQRGSLSFSAAVAACAYPNSAAVTPRTTRFLLILAPTENQTEPLDRRLSDAHEHSQIFRCVSPRCGPKVSMEIDP